MLEEAARDLGGRRLPGFSSLQFSPFYAVKLIVEVQRFYFDHNATTPVSPAVLEVLLPALLEVYGNASSIHQHGQMAKQKLEIARRQVGHLIGSDPKDLVFLSGGTEADNLAILGTVRSNSAARKHLVTTSIEH